MPKHHYKYMRARWLREGVKSMFCKWKMCRGTLKEEEDEDAEEAATEVEDDPL